MHPTYPGLIPYGVNDLPSEAVPPGTCPARVVRRDGATVLAMTPYGARVLHLSARLQQLPTVGDWVAIPASPTSGAHFQIPVVELLPRKSLLRRMSAEENGEQALAANVDLVLITCGSDRPIRAGRIQRVAAQAWDCGATPVLVITKGRRSDGGPIDLPRLELAHPGVQVLLTSVLEGVGIEQLRDLVGGRTAVLVGESGAGKSTLINALLGRAEAATGEVRAGDAKGRHTTTSRQLHLLPGAVGGSIIDTPGVRAFGLAADASSVDAVFAEIGELARACRFSDCRHRTEPGCAVLEALRGGTLAQARYDGWLRLQREVASAALRSSPHDQRVHEKQFAKLVKTAKVRKRD